MSAKKGGALVPNVSRVIVPFPPPMRGSWYGTFLRYGKGKQLGKIEVAPEGGGPTEWVTVANAREVVA